MQASFAREVQSILGDIGPILLAAFRPHQMTGIGQNQSFTGTMPKVSFPIRKRPFGRRSANRRFGPEAVRYVLLSNQSDLTDSHWISRN
jgi:hypothetical protein